MKELSLVALPTDGAVTAFDGLRLSHGVHLRWSFRRNLGFPAGGFTIFRDGTEVAAINLAFDLDTAVSHLVSDPAQFEKLQKRYKDSADGIVELLNLLTDPSDNTPTHLRPLPALAGTQAEKITLYALDALLLASLDPYIARMLGLYWIDTEVTLPQPEEYVEYTVVGYWEDRPWPLHVRDLTRLSSRNFTGPDYSELDVDGVRILGDKLRLWLPEVDDIYVPHLQQPVSKDGDHILRFLFPKPVAEVILELAVDMAYTGWRAVADGLDAVLVTLPDAEGSNHTFLRFTLPGDSRFERLELSGPPDPGEPGHPDTITWRLYRLSFREQAGPIDDLASDPLRVYLEPVSVPPATPQITRLKQEPAPLILGEDGQIVPTNSQVALAGYAPAAPGDTYRPVRLHVARSPMPHSGQPAVEHILTLVGGQHAPASYRPPQATAVLPGLIGAWPLDGDTRNLKTSIMAQLRGPDGYLRQQTVLAGRQALSLRGNGFVENAQSPALPYPNRKLAIQARLNPRSDLDLPTIVGQGRDRSYWLGLTAGPDPADYHLQLCLNGHSFTAGDWTIPSDQWTEVAAVFDGNEVRLYRNGGDGASFPASHVGPIQPSSEGALCFGADSGSRVGALIRPFRGELADVRLWLDALHPLEADQRFADEGYLLAGHTAGAGLVQAWPDVLTFTPADPAVTIANRPELESLGTQLTLELWLRPETGPAWSAPVDNNKNHSFALELERTTPSDPDPYRVVFRLNGSRFSSVGQIAPRRWAHLAVTHDGQQVQFYLDGRLDTSHPAVLGAVGVNPDGALKIGQGYAGQLADLHLWRQALTPRAASQRLSQVQYLDRGLPDGRYAYQLQGIDLFGRPSLWSTREVVTVRDQTPPPPPANVQARYLPLVGSITEVTELSNACRLVTDISVPATLITSGTADVPALAGYDVQLARPAPLEEDGAALVYRQTFEIRQAHAPGGRLRLVIEDAPFAQLEPRVGDALTIAFDLNLEMAWTWTGQQRLFVPRAQNFQLYLQAGPLNVLAGQTGQVRRFSASGSRFQVRTNLVFRRSRRGLEGLACQVGAHRYRIVDHTTGANIRLDLEYSARPVVVPLEGAAVKINLPDESRLARDFSQPGSWRDSLPLDPAPVAFDAPVLKRGAAQARALGKAGYSRLHRAEVDWLPETGVYRVRLAGITIPEALRRVSPQAFVPGALVAQNFSLQPPVWQVYTVLWHEWDPVNGFDIYLHYTEPEGVSPDSLRLRDLRIYPGQRYRQVIEAPAPFAPGQGRFEWACGVTAVDEAGRESVVGQIATLVAVDRRRPPTPPAPMIEAVEPADYYGKSQVRLTWQPPEDAEAVSYQLYRAVDTAIFARDMEQRRLWTGEYQGLRPRQVFISDQDFGPWLAARFPEKTAADIFPDSTNKAAWQAVTPIWRAWADRFYPALTDNEIRQLARLPGNETAFTLVNDKPIPAPAADRPVEIDDVVDGQVRNRYFYRLRALSPALQSSAAWSPVSGSAVPPKVKPPRAPVITRIEAGDRSITLHWALNREPDLKEYRLYRVEALVPREATPAERGEILAARRAELDDLRWWGDEPDPRLVATLPDPRFKVRRRRLRLPTALQARQVLGVYRADEFEFEPERDPIQRQPQALNYYDSSDASDFDPDSRWIFNLRRIADGTAMVIVFRDVEGVVKVAHQRHPAPPYLDEGLLGLTDYFYRLVAVDEVGNVSEGSKVLAGRAVDLTPPEPPTWEQAEWVAGPGGSHFIRLRWTVGEPGTSCILQRKTDHETTWRAVTEWLASPLKRTGPPVVWVYQFEDKIANPEIGYEYRVQVVSRAGNMNEHFESVFIQNTVT